MNNPENSESCHYKGCFCLSWGAVFAGAAASLGLSFLMNLLNAGLGFSIYALGKDASTAAITTVIWVLITTFLAMLISGLISGCLAQKYYSNCWSGVLHGFIAWCVSLVVMLALAAHFTIALPVNMQMLVVQDQTVATSYEATRTATTLKNAPQTVSTDDKAKAASVLGALSLQAFVIFLIGALASSLGGYLGMACGHKCTNTTTTNVNRNTQL